MLLLERDFFRLQRALMSFTFAEPLNSNESFTIYTGERVQNQKQVNIFYGLAAEKIVGYCK